MIAEAEKKEEPQASIKEEGEERMGSLLLPASLEEPSFFSASLFWLLLLLLPLLLLPPLGLEPLPHPDCLEPDPVSCLLPRGVLDLSRLVLEPDLLRDLDLDL